MISATSVSNRAAGRRGFSLIEILVVIGIIIVLAGILLPAVIHAYKSANSGRAAADLQALSAALEAYKADFGDYPRDMPTSGLTMPQGDGAYLMSVALLGPGYATVASDTSSYPAWVKSNYAMGSLITSGSNRYMYIGDPTVQSTTGPTDTTGNASPWLQLQAGGLVDGADGPGFRIRAGGKVWGPYIQIDRFKLNGGLLVDGNGQAYLYYPTSTGNPNIYAAQSAANGGYSALFTPGNPPNPPTTPQPLYNSRYNFGAIDQATFCCMVGEYSAQGYINSTYGVETPIGNYPYLLVSAGPDGTFGVPASAGTLTTPANTVAKWTSNHQLMSSSCDDVYNFTRP